ncbi:MAG: alginate O-acetyltransferase complex protein AlgI [Solirubrobacterales bacterium]|jgi:D-alanyl-lipoteichoic acid acyltransferase DltB (MBOAT superfamily)|nr:alginate O-acetyltransferase complex protein AlgI [Solirubrobacterales bacterium]
MLFPTIEFAIFFPVVLGLSWLLMPRQELWKPFIIAASYVFYAAASPMFCLLLGGITVGNQVAVRLIHGASARRAARICAVAVGLDLLTLGIFKYYGFFVTDVGDVLDSLALGMPFPLLTIALPIGVSFFTFQAITYVVDVKRGDAEPASLVDAAVYLSFFPHLVAGPIVRASEFLPQLKTPRDPHRVAVGAGLTLIALGLVKKVLIADTLAREIVDPVFGVPEAYFSPDAILAALAYASQIYCDFSGYTDIAIGLALMLGFVFPQNFNSPYRATGFRDFWRRWHMTLSRFLRDYLYIPLGGSRGKTRWFTYRNLMITMLLGGLWHGAAWTFVLWGGFHGAMLCTEHVLDGRVGRRTPAWFRWLGTFLAVCFGWILFRSPDLDVFWTFLGRIVDPGPATLWTVPIVLMIVVVIAMQLLPPRRVQHWQLSIERLRPVALAIGLAVVILFVGATVPSQGVPPFIYFQF